MAANLTKLILYVLALFSYVTICEISVNAALSAYLNVVLKFMLSAKLLGFAVNSQRTYFSSGIRVVGNKIAKGLEYFFLYSDILG